MDAVEEDLDQRIIEFEQKWARVFDPRTSAITRDQDIRATFGIAPMKYYILLASRLDDPQFYERDPVLVARLREATQQTLDRRSGAKHYTANADSQPKQGNLEW